MARKPNATCSHKTLRLETQTKAQLISDMRVGRCLDCGQEDIQIRTPEAIRDCPVEIDIVRRNMPSAYIRKE